MKHDLLRRIAEYKNLYQRKRRWHKVVSVLAGIVVFCTTYALILPAITLEADTICGMVEHVHTEECYAPLAEGEFICTLEQMNLHQHNEDCYDTGGNVICGYADFVLHTHESICYDAEGNLCCPLEERTSYTVAVYGESSGQLAEEESALSVADVDVTSGSALEYPAAIEDQEAIEYTEPHTHTEACYCDGVRICGQLEVQAHQHTTDCLVQRELLCTLPEHTHSQLCYPPEDGGSYIYEDDTLAVTVYLSPETILPEGATLNVRALTDEEENYAEMRNQAESAMPGTADIQLYDISFYTAEEAYIPVSDTATVSLRFKENVLAEAAGQVAVLHYEEEAELPVALEYVVVAQSETDGVEEVTFQTEGFSVFAVVKVLNRLNYPKATEADLVDGASFYILSHNSRYAMMAADAASSSNRRHAEAVTSDVDFSAYTSWKFEKNSDDTYKISSDSQYLQLNGENLTMVDSSQASSFTVEFQEDGHVTIGVNGYYINLYGNESAQQGFAGYSNPKDNMQYLYKVEPPADEILVTDLGGQCYAIVNQNSERKYALSAQPTQNNNYLSATPVELVGSGTQYVKGDNLTIWEFVETTAPGVYYIQDTVSKKYLSLTSNALTVSDTPMKITVTTKTDLSGQVRLAANDRYVDWHGGSNPNNLVFGPWNDDNNNVYHTLYKEVTVGEDVLFYDLNASSTQVGAHTVSANDSWYGCTAPALTEAVQVITADGSSEPNALFHLSSTADDEGYYTLRSSNRAAIAEKMIAAGKSPGKQFRFDGWAVTVADEDNNRQTYLLAEGAAVWLNEAGKIVAQAKAKLEDGVQKPLETGETQVILEPGTTLTGQWTEVSDLALFFVNYSGTILDTEDDVSGRNQRDFTGIVGIGHVYYGTQQAGSDNVFGSDANQQIRVKFVPAFDPNDAEAQIVMDYITTYDGGETGNSDASDPQGGAGYALYTAGEGINDTELDNALLKFIQENKNVTIKVSTADNANNPEIENENSTADNYTVRWYVLKEQVDAWHIDGVMVAKTAEIAVTKTFSGLTTKEAGGLMAGYKMPVKLGEAKQDYITMTTTPIPGQYEYHGVENLSSLPNSYHWVLHAIANEQYTLSEENYELEGYDVSSVIVHYYTSKLSGMETIAYVYETSTAELAPPVLGGQTTAVSFNNFYTETGTGAMAIVKRDSTTSGNDLFGTLAGAKFTLYAEEIQPKEDSEGTTVATAITNANGTAYFNNLEPGTYTLQETRAPEGYQASDKTWTVTVTKESTGVVVRLYERDANGTRVEGSAQVLYNNGIKGSYTVNNSADANTVTIVKKFSGLTLEEMDNLVEDSKAGEDGTPQGYYIELQGAAADSNVKTNVQLTLDTAIRAQDRFTFTWNVENLAEVQTINEETTPIAYTLCEHSYLHASYADTIVTMTLNGETKPVTIDRNRKQATVSDITFTQNSSDQILLTNHYTKTFDLNLQKLDSETQEALSGAEFKIYGPYRESTNTSQYFDYTEDGGTTTRYYYVGTATSGEDGIATITGLTLSKGETNFVYVLNEETAPNGYAPAEPQIITVNVDENDSRYDAGVLTVKVPNTLKESAKTSIAVDKAWIGAKPDGTKITLYLYKKAGSSSTPELVGTCTLDGTAVNTVTPVQEAAAEEATPTVTQNGWTATWSNLAAYTESGEEYTWYICEAPIASFATTYSNQNGAIATVQLRVDDNTVTAAPVTGTPTRKAVTITNRNVYELPETGGQSSMPYRLAGFILLGSAAGCLYKKRLAKGGIRQHS